MFAPRARGFSDDKDETGKNKSVRPASAGVFPLNRLRDCSPRESGGFPSMLTGLPSSARFAPRARGFSAQARGDDQQVRVRPASAGVFRDTYQHDDQHYRSPRERGGFPPPSNGRYLQAWFAPRARGFSHIASPRGRLHRDQPFAPRARGVF